MPEAADQSQNEYQTVTTHDIETCISDLGCQPILFIGSGLSRRYFGAPNWDELLETLGKHCPLIDKDYAYYKQKLKTLPAIGRVFGRLYQEWAWGEGRENFPETLFTAETRDDAYIKHWIAKLLTEVTPQSLAKVPDEGMRVEIEALRNIRPHALITTNYEQFLEKVFPDYQPVIGQSIIRGTQVLNGEIFKIHGCVSEPDGLVFTDADYTEFSRKKKYLSAKLLTYFTEHPLLFVGYSATDPNIQAILSDIDECLAGTAEQRGVIPNIYLLEWKPDMPVGYSPSREKMIVIGEGRSIRVKSIEAAEFNWVFEAFGANQPLNAVNPKVLRALLSRSYDLVRYDIPRKTLQADFQFLEDAVSSDESFAKLFGIATVGDGSAQNANFPYTTTDLAVRLTGNEKAYWNAVMPFVNRVSKELGQNIKASDNRYHLKTKTGRKSYSHKYSPYLLEAITRMRDGQPYTLEPIS